MKKIKKSNGIETDLRGKLMGTQTAQTTNP